MPELAVTAIGRDRPGIVAALSGALLELDGNIEDSQMSILGGHFAVMLLVRVPDAVDAEEVAERLERTRAELGLEAVTVAEIGPGASGRPRPSHVLSVYGADHPGIVHAVSQALADLDANITDLETRLAGTPERPVYVMMLEVDLGATDPERVRAGLERVGHEAGVEVALRELETETL